ncbi:homocysteine S-methyltransferase family protein [Jiella avicenniae]|uniref:Homocysteine S-methyltransferase family protein n=1 Tax=Jiella avicenniae TaxID=2907202 RepID=A0A9X1NZJ4_9HYPH|nr:homocysteine S-methyltransferase family protein [Jiella avicenniae]MCE7026583.1 homocysteine S-methyltransferase family protein [Jiella avicenniae]
MAAMTMIVSPFSRLDDDSVLLADGAMGTNLLAAGLPAGVAPERWLTERPEAIAALHHAFVAAGSDVVLTCSFGANAPRLALWGAAMRTRELNRLAADLARRAVERASRPVLVAGSVGPTWRDAVSGYASAEDEAVGVFAEQIAGLKAGGIDFVWLETMVSAAEARAAARAAISVGLPYVATASFGAGGTTPAGLSAPQFAAVFEGLEVAPLAIGTNCCEGPDTTLACAAAMERLPGVRLAVKPNCGLPRSVGEDAVHPEGPGSMARFAKAAIERGATILGGCCGAEPAHVAAMRQVIDRHGRRS